MYSRLFVLFWGISFAAAAQSLPEDVGAFLREVMHNQRVAGRDATEYTGEFRSVMRWYKLDGRLDKEESSSGETYQSRQRNEDVTLVKNGKPVRSRQVEKIRKTVAERLQKDQNARLREAPRETSQPEEGPEYGMSIGDIRMAIYDVIRNCQFGDLRQDAVDGRPALAIDFDGCRDSGQKNLQHLPLVKGTLWIDQQDRIVSHWQAWKASGEHAGELVFEGKSGRSEGGWAGGSNYLNLYVLGEGARISLDYRTLNMQRFGVDVTQTIGDPAP